MKTTILEGMVSRAAEYRESDRMLTILTPQAGKLSANARGSRKPSSPLLACSQPFCYGEFTLKEINGILYVNQCDLRESFFDLRTDFLRLEAAAMVLRLCESGMKKNVPAPELFYHAYSSIAIIAYGENPPADGLICFLLNFLRIMGYTPGTTRCALCGKSTYGGGFSSDVGALCPECTSRRAAKAAEPLTLLAMSKMLCISLENMKKVVLPEQVRTECGELLGRYYEEHFGTRMKLRECLNRLIFNNH